MARRLRQKKERLGGDRLTFDGQGQGGSDGGPLLMVMVAGPGLIVV